MFWQYYLGSKKPTFLARNPEQVYATILQFSKSNDLLKNCQTYSHPILETSRNFLDMVFIRLQM